MHLVQKEAQKVGVAARVIDSAMGVLDGAQPLLRIVLHVATPEVAASLSGYHGHYAERCVAE